MPGNVTTMVIEVDLRCEKCRNKIKKVLCKISEINNQIYDEKSNTVTITVGCGCPEKVKEKIRCKAGDIILGIEIKAPPEAQKKSKKPSNSASNPTDGNTSDDKKPCHPKEQPKCGASYCRGPCMPPPCHGSGGCRGPCKPPPCHGSGGCRGPCMPPPCHGSGGCRDPCMPTPCHGSGGCSGIYGSRCSDYICEENPTAPCRIM